MVLPPGISRDSKLFRQKVLVWAPPHFGILLNSAFGHSGVRFLPESYKTYSRKMFHILLLSFVQYS